MAVCIAAPVPCPRKFTVIQGYFAWNASFMLPVPVSSSPVSRRLVVDEIISVTGVGVGVGEGEGDGEGEAVGLEVGFGDAVGEVVVPGLGEGLTEGEGDGEDMGVGVGVGCEVCPLFCE
jgi:hypothetical protein